MSRSAQIINEAIDKVTYPHTVVYFSESLYTKPLEDSVSFGNFTNITGAIYETSTRQPSVIAVISDGNHNVSTIPLSRLSELNIPVYCFGVGSATQRDVTLADLSYPEYVYVNDSIHVLVTVQSQGFEAGTGTIDLTMKNAKVQSATYPLSTVTAKSSIEFWIPATEIGDKTFKVVLEPLSGENSYENNEAQFSVRILKEKLKVLYYTEHISFSTKFVLRALTQNSRVELMPVARVAKGVMQNLNTHEPGRLPSLNVFDVIILDNCALSRLPWTQVEEFLQHGGGILCMGVLEGQTARWRDVLPITTTTVPIKGTHALTIVEPFSVLTPYNEYPPLSTINRVRTVKQDAVIIAQTKNIPVFAYRAHAGGLVFQINTTDLGTWQFLWHGMKNTDILSTLLADIVRFIAPSGHSTRLVLESLRREYTIGETAEMTLQSFDRDYRRSGGGDFFMEYGTQRIPFFETQKGVYKASFIIDKPGQHKLTAHGKLHEEELQSNEVKLRVSEGTVESEQGLNKEFLQAIASKTGGAYAPFKEFGMFEPPPRSEQYIVSPLYLDAPIIYFVIVVLLAAEWFLRRRKGTL